MRPRTGRKAAHLAGWSVLLLVLLVLPFWEEPATLYFLWKLAADPEQLPARAAAPDGTPQFEAVKRFLQTTDGKKSGWVLWVQKPVLESGERGCQELMTADGLAFPNVLTFLVFEHEGRRCEALWSSRLSRNQVPLYSDQEYKFLGRMSDTDAAECRLQKVWKQDQVIWEGPDE